MKGEGDEEERGKRKREGKRREGSEGRGMRSGGRREGRVLEVDPRHGPTQLEGHAAHLL